ncbi:MAG: tRNA (N(6)-L-threonylcarbamoyladenosine(37)-C(2))-methylthiotransferase MtaB [Candidatus Gastranaerophilales bacterium]|nr:tRNA (N(6)-L-threonylcarbamoyladenosine(37)-C(2))-methylthiotransferase MtaB [Candidatus Gastranaerophilales bacterium]
MKNFIIKTLGCKTNQVESALIAELLINAGFCETDIISNADYYILNSCSVTHIADSKNFSYLRHSKRENPKIINVVTGCMAQLEKENLLKSDEIDVVIGNNEKNDIVKILENNEKYNVSDIFSHDKFRYNKLNQTNRTRASVKIQDGCNNRCTYCTIPFARGKNRSNPVENIEEQINLFAKEGFYETVLTGIHIGQWGLDFNPQQNFQNLLEKIEDTNIYRYRLGSLDPLELSDGFIDFLSVSKKFCPHFHLSLQSVCNNTLKRMNRYYTEEHIKHLVEYINSKFENAFIGCDIIVGFPGETIQDFDTTLENLTELKLSKIHTFPYSRRKGTIADKMPNQIDNLEKKQRAAIIQKLSDKKNYEFKKSNMGCIKEIIIEKSRDKKTGLLKGVSENYINVLIDAPDKYKDTLQKVILRGFSENNDKLIGELYFPENQNACN